MKTKGELVSDLELRFTESKPSDDLELEREQLAHWLDLAANAMLADNLSKQISRAGEINPYYYKKSSYIVPEEEGLSDVDAQDERYFIDISSLNILAPRGYGRDYGVARVQDETNKQVVPITPDESDFYKYLWFGKADQEEERYHWYRENGNIFIDGVDANSLSYKRFRVFYVEPIDSTSLIDSDTYPLDDTMVPMVVDIAEEIGWRQFREPINDLENDGEQGA